MSCKLGSVRGVVSRRPVFAHARSCCLLLAALTTLGACREWTDRFGVETESKAATTASTPQLLVIPPASSPGSAPAASPPAPSSSAVVANPSPTGTNAAPSPQASSPGATATVVSAADVVARVTESSLFAATPSTIGAKLAGIVNMGPGEKSAEWIQLNGSNPSAGVQWATAGFSSRGGANPKWRFMLLNLAFRRDGAKELQYEALYKELVQRLGKPIVKTAESATWQRRPHREFSLRVEKRASPLVAHGAEEAVVILEAGEAQGEGE